MRKRCSHAAVKSCLNIAEQGEVTLQAGDAHRMSSKSKCTLQDAERHGQGKLAPTRLRNGIVSSSPKHVRANAGVQCMGCQAKQLRVVGSATSDILQHARAVVALGSTCQNDIRQAPHKIVTIHNGPAEAVGKPNHNVVLNLLSNVRRHVWEPDNSMVRHWGYEAFVKMHSGEPVDAVWGGLNGNVQEIDGKARTSGGNVKLWRVDAHNGGVQIRLVV